MVSLPIADYDYELPEELIAQTALEPRDSSRMLVLRRDGAPMEHAQFFEIGRYLRAGDLLVANESRVLPARLYGRKGTGGQVEALLLRRVDERRWEALVRGRGIAPGTRLTFSRSAQPAELQPTATKASAHSGGLQGRASDVPAQLAELEVSATVEAVLEHGGRLLAFERPLEPLLEQLGVLPLPPYIHAPVDPERYQTIYSRTPGSAAAPTAGLHFTPGLIEALQDAGVGWATVTLHVGLDTFKPVQEQDALKHRMHSEWFELPAATAEAIRRTRQAGGRVVAVGTTTVRVLESAAALIALAPPSGSLPHRAALPSDRRGDPPSDSGAARFSAPLSGSPADDLAGSEIASELVAASGWTEIFIYPSYRFKVVDALVTNFHLPRSTLLLLVSAFAGRELIMRAYQEAVARRYRFFSLGDAMLLL